MGGAAPVFGSCTGGTAAGANNGNCRAGTYLRLAAADHDQSNRSTDRAESGTGQFGAFVEVLNTETRVR
ncbi:hypothetical protein EN35_30245 [Rhodococcus qingshengii]|nr:hypothetical protein EN35_30245 [Rhodococcus qingshengii]